MSFDDNYMIYIIYYSELFKNVNYFYNYHPVFNINCISPCKSDFNVIIASQLPNH